MFININGYNLTAMDSVDTVILCEEPLGFIVSLKSGRKTFARLMQIPGVQYGDDSPFKYMIFVPRSRYRELVQALSNTAKWRTKEDISRDQELIHKEDITLSEVLSELDTDFSTKYMKKQPFPFQKLAVSWAIEEKGKHKIKGGLLADLMGLGKTIEGMTTALRLKNEGKINNCLIICPATLKTQWQQEIESFSHESSIIIESRGGRAFKSRKELYNKIKEEKTFFTIINFEMLIRREVVKRVPVKGKTKTGKQRTKNVYGDFLDIEELKEIGYDMIIIDEAHNMKNPDTLVAQAIRELDAEYKLLMTGTPIEKELKNVFQLFDFIHPQILIDEKIDSFEERRQLFEEQYVVTRMNPFLKYTNEIEYIGNKNAEQLRKRINPFLLRRRPEDVSDEMPDQAVRNISLEFEPRQRRLYDKASSLLEQTSDELDKVAKNETDKIEKLENRTNALRTMRRVICSTPEALLSSKSPIAKEIIGKAKSFPSTHKEDQLLQMIEELCLENKQKVVIFTKFARVANALQKKVEDMFQKHAKRNKEENYRSFVYEGETPFGCEKKEKEPESERIDCLSCEFLKHCGTRTQYAWMFQNDPDTKVLIATDAGNSGVNLQSGNHLINYDLPSNFSTYLQRNGRIRRLGSEHQRVFIHNLIIQDSVDEDNFRNIQTQMKTNDLMIENRPEDIESIQKASNNKG